MSSRTAQDAKTLAQRYYTGQDVYEAETRNVFFQRWLYVGRTTSLAGSGSYFLFEIESESVIVLRDSDGEIRAHHNVCRHRGTRLLAEPKGQLPKTIQCLYHAWTYSLDGTLGVRVQGGRRFVQQEYACVFEQDACDGQPLLLPHR